MNVCLLLAFLLPAANASPQTGNVPTDTLLNRLYEQAANLMAEGELEAAQQCFDKAFAVEDVGQSPLYPILLNEQATLYVYAGNEQKGLEGKKSVLPYLPQVKDLETHISVYNDLGILYRHVHEPDSALFYYNKALDAALKYGDASWLAHLYMNVAVFHYNLKHVAEAEQYIDQALQYARKTDEQLALFNALQVGASIKMATKHTEQAGQYIRQAWQMACRNNSPEWKIRCMSGFYAYFAETGQNDSVDYYLHVGNKLLKDLPPHSIAARGFLQARAKTEMTRGKYEAALQDYLLLKQEDTGTERHTLYADMAHCYRALGQSDRAFACMDSARLWTDSLARQELTNRMAQLNVKYKTQEKELQNARLSEQLLQKEAMQLRTIAASVIGLLVALIVLLTLRHKQKAAERRLKQLQHEKELEAARRYTEGLETECKYFAKELHDGIANDLLALQMKLASATPGEALPAGIEDMVIRLRENVRNISHELMPPDLERQDLDRLLSGYAALLSDSGNATITYRREGSGRKGNQQTDREIYRIVQEYVANCLKYAQPSYIDILLATGEDGRCTLTITDNGKPFEKEGGTSQGIGLRTINDRARTLNGTISRERAEQTNIFTLTFSTTSATHA